MNLKLIQLITFIFLNISHAASAVESASSPAHFGEEYSVNFMWLNSKPQLDQPYVCPGSDLEVKTKLLDGAIAAPLHGVLLTQEPLSMFGLVA